VFFIVKEVTIRIRNIFVRFEETSTVKLLNFRRSWDIFKVVIVLLFLSNIFEDLIRAQMVGQLPEAVVITRSKTSLNEIFFFVSIIIEQLR